MIVSREVAATTPPSRPPRSWNGEGEVLWVVPLLCAEGGESRMYIVYELIQIWREYILFIGIRTLCLTIITSYGYHSP